MAALRRAWAGLDAGAQRSMTVRAAMVSAYCACDSLGDASAALHDLLDLYAVLSSCSQRMSQPNHPGSSPGQEALVAASSSVRGADESMAGGIPAGEARVEDDLEGVGPDVHAAPEVHRGVPAALGSGRRSRRGSMGTVADAAYVPGASSSGQNTPDGAWESLEEARRAAAQACHQVIHAAGRLGAADVAHEAALAMHQARIAILLVRLHFACAAGLLGAHLLMGARLLGRLSYVHSRHS